MEFLPSINLGVVEPQDTEWDRTKAQLGAALVNQVIKAGISGDLAG